jgi:hypothetical protein
MGLAGFSSPHPSTRSCAQLTLVRQAQGSPVLALRLLFRTFLDVFSRLFRSNVGCPGSLLQVRQRDVVVVPMIFIRLAAATT